MDYVTRTEFLKELATISERINDLNKRLSDFTEVKVDAVTPYTETKQAYIGDTEVTFYDVPSGNLTVFFDKPYTVERHADRIIVSFEELEEVTEITISVL